MNIRIIEEENRLHLVFEGITGSSNEAIKAFIKTISGLDVPENKIDDFEPISDITPEKEAEIIREVAKQEIEEQNREISEEHLKEKYLEEFRKGREKYYYSSFKTYGTLNNVQKSAYTDAFREWVKEYFSKDPYVLSDQKHPDLKNHRGFFKVFAKMLPDEIASSEKQLGIEKGRFADVASNEEIMQVFELCRKSLLERAAF